MGKEKYQLKYSDVALSALLILLTYLLGFTVGQQDFPEIILYYSLFFGAYLFISNPREAVFPADRFALFIGLSILLRLVLVFSLPNLSNDVFRFIWDGRLLVQGHNPFDHLPMYYLENETGLQGIDRSLFESFGSKNFHTVYPPVAQAQFASACWLFPNDIYWSAVAMKLWLFLFETVSIVLIVKLLENHGLPRHHVFLYALNPLILFEITGNLHFEGAMICFLLLAVWLAVKGRFDLSAAAFALSICSKLLTLLFLPFLVYRLGWGRSIRYFLIVGVVCGLLFFPIVNAGFLGNFSSSLGLYFQKLEFNASLYYVLRWVGYLTKGYNEIALIGPKLGLLAGFAILCLAFAHQKKSLLNPAEINWPEVWQYWLFAIASYLFCTTTMHPWYTALPIALCVFTPYRFPVLWSYLVFWTYINYSYQVYWENGWIVIAEYALLFGYLIWEIKHRRPSIFRQTGTPL